MKEEREALIKARLKRATEESILILKVKQDVVVVVGTNGNVYHVAICVHPECSCKDFKAFNRYWSLCKHILYLCVKVTGLSLNNVIRGILSKDDTMLVWSKMNTIESSISENAVIVYNRFESNCCQICSGICTQNESKWVCSIYHSECLSVYHNSCLSEWVKINPSKRDECPICKRIWFYDFAKTICNPYLNVQSLIKHVGTDEPDAAENIDNSTFDMMELEEKVKESWKNWKPM